MNFTNRKGKKTKKENFLFHDRDDLKQQTIDNTIFHSMTKNKYK